MYENITKFLNGRTFDDVVKAELFTHYIKYREEKTEDGEGDLYLLINRKNETEIQKECNGLIFEKKTNKIVCAAYPDFEKEKLPKENLVSVEYCEDGTVIRLYNYNNKWYTATKKCINAVNSKWSSQSSFDTMFFELFGDKVTENLDTNKTYIFILLHSDNVLVVQHKQRKLVYTGCIDNTTYEHDNTFIFENHPNVIPTLKIEMNMIDFDNENYETMFNPVKRGLIFKYMIGNDYKFYKYDFNEYQHVKDIRGNVPFIGTRYLQLLVLPDLLSELLKYYPQYEMIYAMIEHGLQKVSTEIYYLYRNSHVKHDIQVDETNKYYQTIKQLHGQYKKTKMPITKIDVYNKVRSLPYYVLEGYFNWVSSKQ